MTLTNATRKMRTLAADNDGTLPSFAWPGGYPLFYVDTGGNILCPTCANENDEYSEAINGYDINYEDSNLFCDHCSQRIESAYAED